MLDEWLNELGLHFILAREKKLSSYKWQTDAIHVPLTVA